MLLFIRILVSLALSLQIPVSSAAPKPSANDLNERVQVMNAMLSRLRTSKNFLNVLASIKSSDQANFKKLAEVAPNVLLPQISVKNGQIHFQFADEAVTFEGTPNNFKLNGKQISSGAKNVGELLERINQSISADAVSRVSPKAWALNMLIGETAHADCGGNIDCLFSVGGGSSTSRLKSAQSRLSNGLIGIIVSATIILSGAALATTAPVWGTAVMVVGGVVFLATMITNASASPSTMPKEFRCNLPRELKIIARDGTEVEIKNPTSANPSEWIDGKPVPEADVAKLKAVVQKCPTQKEINDANQAVDLQSGGGAQPAGPASKAETGV